MCATCLQMPSESRGECLILGAEMTVARSHLKWCWEANLCLASRRAACALNCRDTFPTHVFTFFRLPFVLTLHCCSGMFEEDNFFYKENKSLCRVLGAQWSGIWVSSLPLRVLSLCQVMDGRWQWLGGK